MHTPKRKEDRRVTRTKSAIREAFFAIACEVPYSKITVTAIAKQANIDRKTFYTHYSSIDEVLEDSARIRFEAASKDIDLIQLLRDPKTCTETFLRSIDSFYLSSLSAVSNAVINIPYEKEVACWKVVMKEHLLMQLPHAPEGAEESMDVLLDFFLGGIANAYTQWVATGKRMPIQEVTSLLCTCVSNGLIGAVRERMALRIAAAAKLQH